MDWCAWATGADWERLSEACSWATAPNQLQGFTAALLSAVLSALVALLVVKLTNGGAERSAREGRVEAAAADALAAVNALGVPRKDGADPDDSAEVLALSTACARLALAANSRELLEVLALWSSLVAYRRRAMSQHYASALFAGLGMGMPSEDRELGELTDSPSRMAGVLVQVRPRRWSGRGLMLPEVRAETGRALRAVLAYGARTDWPAWRLEQLRSKARALGVPTPVAEADGAE
uniref:hypothetical protein n=1 Tax=uncultured Micrococcus sp. TaxID=114051 RepID=UPI002623DF54|nr:hypothetical protein [uncultured Micrococcus sp.]